MFVDCREKGGYNQGKRAGGECAIWAYNSACLASKLGKSMHKQRRTTLSEILAAARNKHP